MSNGHKEKYYRKILGELVSSDDGPEVYAEIVTFVKGLREAYKNGDIKTDVDQCILYHVIAGSSIPGNDRNKMIWDFEGKYSIIDFIHKLIFEYKTF